ncbi:PTS fructose transporter subunit IIBC [Candidatus Williamhamiltonella defendens]|uniref:PTS fructose transporter subunit IIBC n=1 Tax=Candidatus Williamhamiltonella defendens TaxID=138072 RepID=UPI00130DD9B3|nr:PTS fructose transporter subunit IIBC [Candidatus Hamiltonella defensa]
MKTLLIIDSYYGPASQYLAEWMLKTSADKLQLHFVEKPDDAELIIAVGEVRDEFGVFTNKKLFTGSLELALNDPDVFLKQALSEAKIYQPSKKKPDLSHQRKRIVAITACPTGVAHTFMAAEAIASEAHKRNFWVKVETRGSVGATNTLTDEDITAADLVIVAADIEANLDKFQGKKLYRTSTSLALKKTAQEFDNALATSEIYHSPSQHAKPSHSRTDQGQGIYGHLLTGVSYMLPMVVAGGLCIALSFIFGIKAFETPGTFAAALMQIGGASAFALMVPVLSGFIAFSIADRPGLTPGLIGGMLAVSTGAGFLGGIIAGFLAGYVSKIISTKLYLPSSMNALKPILIIPLISSLVVGLIMIYLIGEPVGQIMAALTNWLKSIETANAVLLGAILGGMMCSDMGGPVNKAAYSFGVALLSSSVYAPMAAIMSAGMVPSLAMGLATFLAKQKFETSEREAGKAALVLGLCFVSEGAIPFAARDPMRVLPCCIAGGALTGALSMMFGAKLMAPHGGLFVLIIPGAIHPAILYLVAILAGTVLTGILYSILKSRNAPLVPAA